MRKDSLPMSENRARNRDWYALVAALPLDGQWHAVESFAADGRGEYRATRAAGNLNETVRAYNRRFVSAAVLNIPKNAYEFEARGPVVWGRSN